MSIAAEFSPQEWEHGFIGRLRVVDLSDPETSMAQVQARTHAWIRLMRQQHYHLGVVGLLSKFPQLQRVVVDITHGHGRGFSEVIRVGLSDIAPGPVAPEEVLRKVERALSKIRGAAGNNSKEGIDDILMHLRRQPQKQWVLTREAPVLEQYVLAALGPFGQWSVAQDAAQALANTVEGFGAHAPTPPSARRQRL